MQTTRRTTAVIVAAGALLLAALAVAPTANAATLYACVKKSGSAHIYAKKPKCKKHETKLSWSAEGPAGKNGLNGLSGANGKEGPAGATGPQGPGASTFTFDASASATPTRQTLGTVLGDTIAVDCFAPAVGEAELRVYVQTTDGSWAIDFDSVTTNPAESSSIATRLSFPAGTLGSLLQIDQLQAGPAPYTVNRHYDFVQLGPVKGHMVWHENAETTTAASRTCHFSVQSFPSS
ncbi:MAG TPA: collagen-like protein [Solirubrobacteraceae bacterium]|jgi:hypothetical protein|nr:collagen-like protein [Solirubrobacteraceae bacterium]